MEPHTGAHAKHGSYVRLGVMVGLSFVAMYILMYAMVDRLENVYMNVNQVYMAGLMAAPMGLIELVAMVAMYRDRAPHAASTRTASACDLASKSPSGNISGAECLGVVWTTTCISWTG